MAMRLIFSPIRPKEDFKEVCQFLLFLKVLRNLSDSKNPDRFSHLRGSSGFSKLRQEDRKPGRPSGPDKPLENPKDSLTEALTR
jgi:hypothetical protein